MEAEALQESWVGERARGDTICGGLNKGGGARLDLMQGVGWRYAGIGRVFIRMTCPESAAQWRPERGGRETGACSPTTALAVSRKRTRRLTIPVCRAEATCRGSGGLRRRPVIAEWRKPCRRGGRPWKGCAQDIAMAPSRSVSLQRTEGILWNRQGCHMG
ncbi:hypothetical protein GWK47_020874 [Chionoecetes opilio]|uniref:Uncharacterized protein n=1 Tax=Chionoecetes opilio TaxID=41210 RepID=A0A8J4XXX4_CHIOP|nr:hypothetical protein GWK47_020874 [Chionoecetes opilio]